MLHTHPDPIGPCVRRDCQWREDRNAQLMAHLRRTAIQLHATLGHRGDWVHCQEVTCVKSWQLLEPMKRRL